MSDTKKNRRRLPLVLRKSVFTLSRGALLISVGLLVSACSEEPDAAIARCEVAKPALAALDPVISGEIAAMQLLEEPRMLDGISFLDGNGNSKTLEDFTGKTILMNIWATWCAPCREEMPAFDALQKEFAGDDFAVVAVSVDKGESDKPKAFYEEVGIKNLPFYHDGTMNAFNTIRKENLALGLPVTLLIDENSCVLGSLNGPAEWAGEDARRLIGTALSRQGS